MTAAVAVAARHAFKRVRARSVARRNHHLPHRTALLLSGGGNFSFFHIGVIKVLLEAGLLPRVLSGASAGSLMTSIVGTREEHELAKIHADELKFFGFSERANRDESYTAERFEAELAEILPDVTFAEALEISGRAINISLAAPAGGGVVCGPRTTPDVLVRDAVRASCAVPYVYEPVVVRERRHGRVTPFHSGLGWIDGSLFADVPADFIKREYGVRHTIVSLVNPAVRPFVGEGRGPARSLMMAAARGAALGCAKLGRLSAMGLPPARCLFDTVHRVIQQPYGGDLVLTPSRRFAISGALDVPSSDMVRTLSADGAVRTRMRLHAIREMTDDTRAGFRNMGELQARRAMPGLAFA